MLKPEGGRASVCHLGTSQLQVGLQFLSFGDPERQLMTSRGQGLACWVLAMPPVSPAQPGAVAGGFSEPDSSVFGLALGPCSLRAGWLLRALV